MGRYAQYRKRGRGVPQTVAFIPAPLVPDELVGLWLADDDGSLLMSQLEDPPVGVGFVLIEFGASDPPGFASSFVAVNGGGGTFVAGGGADPIFWRAAWADGGGSRVSEWTTVQAAGS